MKNQDKIEELEQRIIKIEERNKMVEGDMFWETSIIRHILICSIYICICCVIYLCCGYN